jgi:hypothetical protein
LFHRVFLSRLNEPQRLTAAKRSDSSVCAWDLRLQSFERDAWVKHVLRKPDAPDFDAYLSERLNENEAAASVAPSYLFVKVADAIALGSYPDLYALALIVLETRMVNGLV